MILLLALVSLGMGYGLWSKTLTIDGTVNTGEVNAEFSLEEIDEIYDFDDFCPLGGYSIGKDCDEDGFLNDDMEMPDPVTGEYKDVAECTAELLDGLKNPGPQTLKVTITDAYPSFNCFIRYDVHNNGTIPIKLHTPVYYFGDDPTPFPGGFTNAYLHVNAWPPPCFTDETQLEKDGFAYCNLHVHVRQDAAQGATYTFKVTIFAHQWNEEPE